MIIGMDLLCQTEVSFSPNDIKIKKLHTDAAQQQQQHKMHDDDNKTHEENDFPDFNLHDEEDEVKKILRCTFLTKEEENYPDIRHIENKEVAAEVMYLVRNYVPKATEKSPVEMDIILQDEKPVYVPLRRRLAPIEQKEVDKQTNEWLKDGIIQPSCSDYAAPILIVPKKDGTKRICVDFRQINKKIVKDRYPLANIEDTVDRLQSGKIFITLDLRNGFFHVPVKENSRKYTAFLTPNGHYEFLKAPFGLCTSPPVFQRYINAIFSKLIAQGIMMVYMDDIIIPAKDEFEALSRFKMVLEQAAKYGLDIKWKKCSLFRKMIEFLGYEIENGQVRSAKSVTASVTKYPLPKTPKALQRFNGFSGYFRKFIDHFAQIASPLTDMLRTNVKFNIGPHQQEAFEKLKRIISERPVLKIFQQGAETQLHTDASSKGLAAILMQKSDEDDEFHPVHFMSKRTQPDEEKLHSYDLEVLAIVKAVQKFRVYLLGNFFTIVTDCKAFEQTMKKNVPKINRWAMVLEEFDYKVIHRSGNRMQHVDALSRMYSMYAIQANTMTHTIVQAQQEDENTKVIIELLKEKQHEDYVMHNGLLCKQVNGTNLIVVPHQLQKNIIRRIHEQGHFKQRKLETVLCKEFYIPSLATKIKEVVDNCIECILIDRKSGKQECLLRPIPKEPLPLDTFHIDHLGPMPSTNQNYKHILAVVDSFTKFVWLFPTKSTTAEESISKLKVINETFGNPRRIIADKGTAFTANSFQDHCKEENIELSFITTGVSRGNGQIERIHRIVIPVLAKLSIDEPEKWYKHVLKVQQFLNKSYQRSIDMTPFELMIGVTMKTKDDQKIAEIINEEIIADFQNERNEVRVHAHQQIEKTQEENRKSFNSKRKKAAEYKVGDLVSIARTQLGSGMKLREKYFGPYKVTKVNGNDRYDVERIGIHNGPGKTSTSADNMKKWAQ